MREDLISSAVSFLTDPKVQSAPLAKKVSFLESKGMTSEEIEEAMSRANGKSSTPSAPVATSTAVVPQAGGYNAVVQPPPVPQRPSYDWRDVFVAAVLAGGVGYGVWQLAKRLFGPWFKVPTQKELEEDKEALDAQFQAVEESFKAIQEQTGDALAKVTAQSKAVDDSLASLETVLKDLKQGDAQRDEEFKNIKGDVDALKELVPKLMDRNKEAQSAILTDLQNELKSLKSLLAARRPGTSGTSLLDQTGSSTPSTPTVDSVTSSLSPRLSAALGATSRPGIPAWQMAANKAAADKAAAEPAAESPSTSSSTANGSTAEATN